MTERPFTAEEVEAMGMAVDEKVCDIKHVAGMRPHRHITVPIRPDVAPTTVQYVCRCCGGYGAHETAFVCQDGTDDCFCANLTGPEGVASATIDVGQLAMALNATVGTFGWARTTPGDPVAEWLMNAGLVAAEYRRLASDATRGRSGPA